MTYGYDDQGKGRGVLLVGAVVGAMLVGVVWLGTSRLSSPESEPRQAMNPVLEAADEPSAEGNEPSRPASRLERCQSVHEAQSAPLRTAADSLTQWEVHIGAMNKLVVGAITLEQASQFWNDTRAGAHAKLHDFATARRHYAQRIYRCTAPPGRALQQTNPSLAQCHGAVVARGRTLRRATTSLERWERHVHHMDMLRSGEMTAEEATQLWLQNWRKGDREVRAYRATARSGRGLTC